VYQWIIPTGADVLEIGCGKGDLLSSVCPAYGLGLDFSAEFIEKAQQNYPELHFMQADAHLLPEIDKKFDYIILSDLVNDIWDVQSVLNQLGGFSHSKTRIVINFYSRLWEIPLKIAQKLKIAKPVLYQNWLTTEDMKNLFEICGLEVIRSWHEILLPIEIPLLTPLLNRFLARFWPFNYLCMTNMMIARQKPAPAMQKPSVSVVVAARNEAGNIRQIFERVPEMGSATEIVFVEGHSQDDTYETIKRIAGEFERPCQVYQQTGVGKGDAIRLGFQKATGDILMILDADLTVPPEDLPRFYDAITQGSGDFINGVRLVYPMEKEAMRFFNFLGNKFFSLAFSWLLGQSIKDILCGTKVLRKSDYEKISANRSYFGDFDPFGDFDLVFGAVKLNAKIIDVPIRYRERTYGATNIERWKHGLLLLRMLRIAAIRLKFV
jgi:SAM-dependent methyltransferase